MNSLTVLSSSDNLQMLAPHVAEITSDSIIITDKDQKILFVNPAFSKITGYTSKEAIGKTPSILKSGKHSQKFYIKMWDILLKGDVFKKVMINKHKNGSILYEEKVIVPVKNEKGKISHYVSTGRDITDRIQMQQKLKQKAIALKQANEDLETFVYNASHNLRGPVASIIGIASMFHDEIKDEKSLVYCSYVQTCAQNLDEVLKSMLHLQVLCKERELKDSINFTALINRIQSAYAKYEGFSETNFVVTCNLKKVFYSNEKMIDSLFQNLMHNSVKFRKLEEVEKNKVTIDINEFGQGIKIEIKDNGIGIKKTHLPKVFDMYYKGNNTHNGSGLGLYFVRQIINHLGGKISITSKPMCFTSISIYLPRKK